MTRLSFVTYDEYKLKNATEALICLSGTDYRHSSSCSHDSQGLAYRQAADIGGRVEGKGVAHARYSLRKRYPLRCNTVVVRLPIRETL